MIDLSRWNIMLPTGIIVQTIPFQAYESEYFIRNADGSFTFRCPHGESGSQSSQNSTYLRSELRETLANGDDNEANWAISSASLHALVATCTIDSFAASGKAIIGQFHGESNKPPVKLQATRIGDSDTFELFMQHRPVYNGAESKPKFSGVFAIGEPFDYEIAIDASGLLSVTVNEETLTAQFDLASYAEDLFYAKCGMYSQDTADSTGVGQATFLRILMHHGTVAELAEKLTALQVEDPVVEEPVADPVVEEPVIGQPADEAGSDDSLTGTGLDDLLDGGAGKDVLTGGAGLDIFRFSSRVHSYRTDGASFSDRITDFDPAQDRIDLSDLGFVGFGNGYDGTLLVQANAEGTRTYLKSYDADAQGRRFEIALDGNHVSALQTGGIIWLTCDEAIAGRTQMAFTQLAEARTAQAAADRLTAQAAVHLRAVQDLLAV